MQRNPKDAVKNNRQVLFIIEGFNAVNEGLIHSRNESPEVFAALELSKKYGVQVADTIDSLSPYHVAHMLSACDESLKPMIILAVLYTLKNDDKKYMETVYNKIIKPAFDLLITNKIMSAIPDWALKLEKMSYDEFYTYVEKDILKNDTQTLISAFKFALNFIIDSSNELSRLETIDLIDEHPEIEKVFALVGSLHLPFMLESQESIKSTIKDKSYSHKLINLNGRTIETYVVGDAHGSMQGYKVIEQLFKEHLKPVYSNVVNLGFLAKSHQNTEEQEESKENKAECALF